MTVKRSGADEQQARRRIRQTLWFMAILSFLGGVAWFLLSPYMSVKEVVITGAVQVPVEDLLAEWQVVEGRPLVAIRTGTVEDDLRDIPRVASATVRLVFPGRVEVLVRERVDTAWVKLVDRWGLVAEDGVLVGYAATPTSPLPRIRVSIDDPGLGQGLEAHDAQGAMEFISALPDGLAGQTIIQASDQELWVWLNNRIARLGLPYEMGDKATSLLTILDTAPDGLIDVSVPGRPAVRPWDTGTGRANSIPTFNLN